MPKFKIELPEPPDGYGYTGQYRRPQAGDLYVKGIGGDLAVVQEGAEVAVPCFIVKKKSWRPYLKARFYYISPTLEVLSSSWEGYEFDEKLLKARNVFKTKRLAEKRIEHILKLLKELPHE